jgi:hypothetical protein
VVDRSPIQGVLPKCLKDKVSRVHSELEQAAEHTKRNLLNSTYISEIRTDAVSEVSLMYIIQTLGKKTLLRQTKMEGV